MSQIEALMKLGMTEAEAREVLEADKVIEKGKEKLDFDLSPEQEQEAKKMRQADREKKPFIPDLKKRERKPNQPKRDIIQVLDEALTDIADDVTVTNIERQIDFVLDGVRYRVVLSAPRK